MTVTSKEQVPMFPELSVDVHVTVMTPTVSKSAEPDIGTQVTGVSPSSVSVAVGVVYVSAANVPMEKSAGQPTLGPSLSA